MCWWGGAALFAGTSSRECCASARPQAQLLEMWSSVAGRLPLTWVLWCPWGASLVAGTFWGGVASWCWAAVAPRCGSPGQWQCSPYFHQQRLVQGGAVCPTWLLTSGVWASGRPSPPAKGKGVLTPSHTPPSTCLCPPSAAGQLLMAAGWWKWHGALLVSQAG